MIKILFAIFTLYLCGFVHAQDVSPKTKTVYVTVESTKTDFISGLKAENFKVFENGVEQKIRSVRSGSEPMSIGVLFDVSPSVTRAYAQDANYAVKGFLEAVNGQPAANEYFLIGFNRRTELLADWTSEPNFIAAAINRLSVLQNKKPSNTPSLYDACQEALQKLKKGKHGKKVLLLFTDGIDTGSKERRKEVKSLVQNSQILVYTITVGEWVETDHPNPIMPVMGLPELEAAQFLNDLVGMSGGRRFYANATNPENPVRVSVKNGKPELSTVFEKIFRELQSQYEIGYIPSKSVRTDETQNVNVKLSLPSEVKKGKGSISARFREKYPATK